MLPFDTRWTSGPGVQSEVLVSRRKKHQSQFHELGPSALPRHVLFDFETSLFIVYSLLARAVRRIVPACWLFRSLGYRSHIKHTNTQITRDDFDPQDSLFEGVCSALRPRSVRRTERYVSFFFTHSEQSVTAGFAK